MGDSIIIVRDREHERIITCLTDEKELLTIQVDHTDSTRLVGNIYLGRVQNIVKNINAAFVEIAGKQICYLPLSDKERPVFADGGEHPVRVGDALVVQISKDATKTKAPLATANFNLTGKYLVLVHGKNVLGISSKITDEDSRKRLRELLSDSCCEQYCFVVRTNAEGASDEAILAERDRLISEYGKMVENSQYRTCYTKLYSAPPSYVWEVRDGYSDRIDKIVTDDETIYQELQEYMSSTDDPDLKKLEFYQDERVSLSVLYNIESRLAKALLEKVWLGSGAYLVIQPTEALVSIDVNTGKAIAGKQNIEETFFKVNCEAAEEIGRQIRLRNLSGIIIVDFIDMKDEEHKKLLIRKIREVLSLDRIPCHFEDMTALNLVEITRKKIRQPLYLQMEV